MWNQIATPLIFGAIIAIIVAIYGYLVPPFFGRSRSDMPILDIVLLALLIAIIAFALAKLGWFTLTFKM